MKKNKCNVVLVATDKAENALLKGALDINYHRGYLTQDYILNRLNRKSYHLYITSNDEIKEGDWVYSKCLSIILKATNFPLSATDAKKIIASTDTELHKDGVAKIGLPFIEKYITEYNKLTPITTVLVEYDCPYNPSIFPDVWNPKLRSDGTIIIHKIQEVFTKEDIKKAYEKGFHDGFNSHTDENNSETWFEQNY